MICKPQAVRSFLLSPTFREYGAWSTTPFVAGRCQSAPAAQPAELASLIRTLLDAPGLEAHHAAAVRLYAIARASVADALAVVSAEGLLQRVERDLMGTGGGGGGLELAYGSLGVLLGASTSLDVAVCGRIVERSDLLRALVLLVARGYAVPSGPLAVGARLAAASVLAHLSSCAAEVADACARAVGELSDADLQAFVNSAASGSRADPSFSAVSFLAACLGHVPLLHRLVGPAGLPLALARLLTGEGVSERGRMAGAACLRRLVKASREHGPPMDAWARPIIKPLRTAFARAPRGAAPGTSWLEAGPLLAMLSAANGELFPAIGAGLPDLVAAVRQGSLSSACSATVIGNLAAYPGVRAVALREGAVPALVSLLYGKDGTPALSGEEAAIAAFTSLACLYVFEDSRAAISTTDASYRLQGTLLGAAASGLRPETNRDFLFAMSKLFAHNGLPVAALVDTGALAHVVPLSQGGDAEVALCATDVLLVVLLRAEGAEVEPLVRALQGLLPAYGPAGGRGRSALAALTAMSADMLYRWATPEAVLARRPLGQGGESLGQLVATDPPVIARLCGVIQARPDDAFTKDVGALHVADVGCEPFHAGRILHFLDCLAGPDLAAKLAADAPEAVLRGVRAAAARGRWGGPWATPAGAPARASSVARGGGREHSLRPAAAGASVCEAGPGGWVE